MNLIYKSSLLYFILLLLKIYLYTPFYPSARNILVYAFFYGNGMRSFSIMGKISVTLGAWHDGFYLSVTFRMHVFSPSTVKYVYNSVGVLGGSSHINQKLS